MTRRCCLLLAVCLCLAADSRAQVSSRGLIDPFAVERLGLVRSWWTVAPIAESEHITALSLHDGVLCVQTDEGLFHVLDANTGETMWSQRWNEYGMGAPAFQGRRMAVLAGAELFVASLDDGSLLWNERPTHTPTGGLALDGDVLYSPDTRGMLRRFDLTRSLQTNYPFSARGRIVGPPIVNERVIAWCNDVGEAFMSYASRTNTEVRIEFPSGVSAAPSYQEPRIFVPTNDGYVYAINDTGGDEEWTFSAGDPIVDTPIPIGDRLYFVDESRELYCLAVDDGRVIWTARGVKQFASASPEKVFAVDPIGNLLVLDAETGGLESTLATYLSTVVLTNDRTDRVYLAKPSGLIQCVHDAVQETPLSYWSEPEPREPTDGDVEAPVDPDDELFDL